MFDKKNKTICNSVRDIYTIVLKTENKELIEKLENKIEYVYLCAKKMNRRLNLYMNFGELPYADSPGWTEKYWKAQLKQCKRGLGTK